MRCVLLHWSQNTSRQLVIMIPLLAAIVLAGAAGAGPILVSDACGLDTSEADHNKCAVEAVNRRMKSRPRPKELKVRISWTLH